MVHDLRIFTAALAAAHITCAALTGPALGAAARHLPGRGQSHVTKAGHHAGVSLLTHAHRPRPPVVQAQAKPEPEPLGPEVLSPQERRGGELADKNGDSNFLMVDKALGKIILFENHEPIYSGAALTGESTADRLPPDVLAKKFSMLSSLEDKVTPAGRFTVTRDRDKILGTVLNINEIRGKDWGIAIHPVYLGIPSENRGARLRSQDDQDKHITYGCINVDRDTFRFLMRYLPGRQAMPLYILPQDVTMTAAYFPPRHS